MRAREYEDDVEMMTRVLTGTLALVLGSVVAAQELSDAERAAIEARIQPYGEVCVQGDSSCGAAVAVASSAGPRSGEEVYNSACLACHSSGAGGAPKYGDAAAWAERIAKGRDVLHQSGIKGIAGTAMMAKGGCMNCSDEEIMAAVDYMVDGSQ